jgi:hypothetical protein
MRWLHQHLKRRQSTVNAEALEIVGRSVDSSSTRISWTRWPGRARVAIATGATAAGLAAALVGACFALQAVALPRPTGGQLIAAGSLRWLNRQRAIESTSAGSPGAALCVNANVRLGREPHIVHGSLLLANGERLVNTKYATFLLRRRLLEIDGQSAALAAVLAGCPRALERRLGRLLDERVSVRSIPLDRDPSGLVWITFSEPRRRLSLLVWRQTSIPLAVRLGRSRWHYLAPATRQALDTPRVHVRASSNVIVEDRT